MYAHQIESLESALRLEADVLSSGAANIPITTERGGGEGMDDVYRSSL